MGPARIRRTDQCPAAVTITAVVANASPFAGLVVPVAFYHSASKTFIGVAQAELIATETGDAGLTAVSVVCSPPALDVRPAHDP